MKVYLAGNLPRISLRQYLPRRLLTYYYHGYKVGNKPTGEVLTMAAQGCDLFLDSGAFTAMTKQETIPLPAFIDYCVASAQHWQTIAALDIIGDDAASWDAYLAMRAAGVPAIATFHFGEPWAALEKMVNECDYIAFGGLVGVRSEHRQQWLDKAWSIAVKDDGTPRLKVHGFGVTTLHLMTMYPWYSVDSTSWVKSAMFGQAVFPMLDGSMQSVVFSERSPEARNLDGWHYHNLGGHQKEQVDASLAALGFDTKACIADHVTRCIVNAKTYQSFETKGVDRFTLHQPTFVLE